MGPLFSRRRRTIDLAPILSQSILILVGSLGVVLSSCAPISSSPLKSSFAPRKAPTQTLETAVCPAIFLPTETVASLEGSPGFSVVAQASQIQELGRSEGTTVAAESLSGPWNECVVAFRPASLDANCTPSQLEDGFSIIATRLQGASSYLVRLVQNEDRTQAYAHCALAASDRIIVSHNHRTEEFNDKVVAFRTRKLNESSPTAK